MYSHDDSLGAQNISSVLFILAVIIVYVSPRLLFYYYYYSVPALLFFPFSLTSFFTEMSFVFFIAYSRKPAANERDICVNPFYKKIQAVIVT